MGQKPVIPFPLSIPADRNIYAETMTNGRPLYSHSDPSPSPNWIGNVGLHGYECHKLFIGLVVDCTTVTSNSCTMDIKGVLDLYYRGRSPREYIQLQFRSCYPTHLHWVVVNTLCALCTFVCVCLHLTNHIYNFSTYSNRKLSLVVGNWSKESRPH